MEMILECDDMIRQIIDMNFSVNMLALNNTWRNNGMEYLERAHGKRLSKLMRE